MSNFNPLNNFLGRFLNQAPKPQAPLPPPAPRAQGAQSTLPSNNLPGDNMVMKRMAQNFNQAALQNTQNSALQRQALQMESFEKSALIKDLLKMPTEMKEFLTQQNITTQNKLLEQLSKDSNLLKQMFQVTNLISVLGENSKAAQLRLTQLIVELARSGGGNSDGNLKQIKEMMALFASNTNAAALTNEANQALKNLILLYLPWVPLKSENEDLTDFDLEFFEEEKTGGENGGGGESSQSVNVLIRTNNFGNISAYLELQNPNNLTTLINCPDNFPKQMLEKLLAQEAKEINLNSAFIAQSPKKLAVESTGQNVKINAQSNINSYLLLITYSLIRLVIEIDKNSTK